MQGRELLLAVDCGTTSTRALAFDQHGQIVAGAQFPLQHTYPQAGWMEEDPGELWELTRRAIAATLADTKDKVAAIGITNQRETIIAWDRATGRPLSPAIIWQDRRAAAITDALRRNGHEHRVQETTGLILDPYFSAGKMRWALDHLPAVRRAADAGTLCFGTVDCWLLWNLTNGSLFGTDASNAARTSLMDLASGVWSEAMATLFGIPLSALPAILPMTGRLAETTLFGRTIPITGMAGDQQAAAIGQACLHPGMAKCTYGTGIFLLANAGGRVPVSRHRLLATWLSSAPRQYALEGSIFVGGDAVKWLRDGLGIVDAAAGTEALARSVPDSGGVSFVPAFAGLGAPYWQPMARGLLAGITAGTTRAHIVRATLEAMGQQTADLIDTFAGDGVLPATLAIDGGMVANEWLCQDIADVTGLVVERPRVIETTALGAAMLAATGAGLFGTLADAAAAMVRADRRYEPTADQGRRQERRAMWRRAVAQTIAGIG